jgi:hypothetical protein
MSGALGVHPENPLSDALAAYDDRLADGTGAQSRCGTATMLSQACHSLGQAVSSSPRMVISLLLNRTSALLNWAHVLNPRSSCL